jgi:hypothetical protein
MADAIGISRSALQNIESGKFKKITPTIRAYTDLVGWTEASAEDVLAGGEPTQRESQEDAPSERGATSVGVESAPGVPLRIAQALEEGPVLDAAVIPLSDAGDGQMVIVVKGRAGASPDEIKKALLLWEQREMQLRGLRGDEDDLPAAEEA